MSLALDYCRKARECGVASTQTEIKIGEEYLCMAEEAIQRDEMSFALDACKKAQKYGVSSTKIQIAIQQHQRFMIATGHDYTIGLKADGSVFAAGYNYYNDCSVENWENIIAISAKYYHTVGLKADGSVLAVGYNNYNQCNVNDWEDIAMIAAGYEYTVGLKANGSVCITGYNYNSQYADIKKWNLLN